MYTNLVGDGASRTGPTNTLSRRRMLQVGCTGTVVSLMPTGLMASGSDEPSPNLDFGPEYTVLKVRRNAAGTRVALGFRVNGRSFCTVLKSSDELVWRPV